MSVKADGDARALAVDPVAPVADRDAPRVAIVILNWNGRHHLPGCFESLAELDYPADLREVVLVDNRSRDGSVELVRSRFPWVRLEVNERNVGFSAGCNQGARAASDPGVLVFLNNDIRVDPAFLRSLVAPIVAVAASATTAKMLSWDGKVLNSAGGGLNFHGVGIQRGSLRPDDPRSDAPRKTLVACGGAMAIRAGVFEDIGGFDEEFFAYYEDVDLGWRSWVLGHEVHYVPSAVCYHHHSSTSRRVPVERLRLLQIRNPLLACFKNYDEENLRRVLPAMLALAVRRAYLATGLGRAPEYRIEELRTLRRPGWIGRLLARDRRKASIDRVPLADLVAINDLIGQWSHWVERRSTVQAHRRRPDGEILPLFLHPLWRIEQDYGYAELHDGLADFLGLRDLFRGMTTLEEDPT